MWTDQQKDALRAVNKWLLEFDRKKKPFFFLGGYAGTGKSTLARHFAEGVSEPVFAAFTGKASLVMRKAGCVGARTIHSLIYIAEQNEKTGEITFRLNKQSSLADADLLIVDECSMVSTEIGNHLLSFGKPILVLGDPAQLPPVEGAGFFTSKPPDFMLTEIHRQAKENPIIYLADLVRNGIMPDIDTYGESRVLTKLSTNDVISADQILVGRNITREELNRKTRKLLKFDSDLPIKNDRLICLKNDKTLSIFNGGIFTVIEPLTSKYKTQFDRYMVQSEDEERAPLILKIHKSFFQDEVPVPHWKMLSGSQEATYAYAITVHKSQGSQWDHVLLYDESYCFRDDKWKWLYTGITRAAEKIDIFVT